MSTFSGEDQSTNPVYTSFALRATLATMGCYVFMSLADWTEIHTCMITCVVTALAVAEEREHKQSSASAVSSWGSLRLGHGGFLDSPI